MSIENVYSPPQTNVESTKIQKKVYSPTQAALGTLLGGVISSVYFISQNFSGLEDYESIKKTYIYGALLVLATFVFIFFMPDGFPNSIIPVVSVVVTRLLVEKYQFTKEDISHDEDLDFHSNWRVFFVGLIAIVVTIAFFIMIALILYAFGIPL